MMDQKTAPPFLYRGARESDGIPQCVPLPRLVQWAWWVGNLEWYGLSWLKRKIIGWHYTQQKSFESYQSEEFNAEEQKSYFEDRIRFIVYKGKLCISHGSTALRYQVNYLINELKAVNNLESMLDFGCGGGALYVNLSLNLPDIKIYGIDYSPKRIEYAKNLCKQFSVDCSRLSIADGKNLGLSDKSFDVTFTSQVLEQIDDGAVRALRNIGRITRRKIILCEPVYEMANFVQKIYIQHQGYLRNLPSKIENALPEWRILKREMFSTYSNPLEPIMATILVPK